MNKLLIIATFTIFSFFSSFALANDALVGNWENDKIQLNLKADKTYTYKIKILKFKGDWSADDKTLTLNYDLMGKKKKTAEYSFDKGDLLLTEKGKTSRLTKKK